MSKEIQTVILAGGRGSRMQEVTQEVQLSEEKQRHGISTQTGDLLDELFDCNVSITNVNYIGNSQAIGRQAGEIGISLGAL